jgi:hypothetical protein
MIDGSSRRTYPPEITPMTQVTEDAEEDQPTDPEWIIETACKRLAAKWLVESILGSSSLEPDPETVFQILCHHLGLADPEILH